MALKNIANCKPTEFVSQTVKIKRSVEKWLTVTDILGIRSQMPELQQLGSEATPEERAKVKDSNSKALQEQAKKNLSAMFDAIFDLHPQETLELLALCCFVDPNDIDSHPMSEYMDAFSELIESESVIRFFMSLSKVAGMLGSKPRAA